MEALTAQHLSLSYGHGANSALAVEDINLSIPRGEICALAGSSGSGKSSLMRVFAGLMPPTQGVVQIFGEAPNPKRHRLAFVPQNYGLLAWKRVRENILLPARLGHDIVDTDFFEEIVQVLGLADLLKRYPQTLSGGERQRVALARAFVMKPDLLLLDEPFSALDMATAERSYALFRSLLAEFPTTCLFVTHNPREAALLAGHVLLIGGKPGKIIADLHDPSEQEIRNILTKLA